MLFKNLKKLNLILCFVVCFSFISNIAFAGSDLDRALAANNENDSEIIQTNLNNSDWDSLLKVIEEDNSLSSNDKIILEKSIRNIAKAERDLYRMSELIKDNAISKEDYDNAVYNFEQAYKEFQARCDAISEKNIDDKTISTETILEKDINNKTVSSKNTNVNNGYIEEDLAFLQTLSNDELMPLVAIMKDRISDELSDEAKTNPKDNLGEVIKELELYGGNTLANLWRGKGVPYREILEDVCKKQEIQFDKTLSTEELGTILVEQTVANFISKMNYEQKKEFVNELKSGMKEDEFNYILKKVGGINGFISSSGKTIAGLLFDKVSGETISATSIIYGISDSFETNVPTSVQLLTSGVADYFGTLGYLAVAAIAVAEIGGPAYRVTIPAVTYIECMRIIKKEQEQNMTSDKFMYTIFILFILLLVFILLFIIFKNIGVLKNQENGKKIEKTNKNIANESKLICPKCNIENNMINSFCTNCHYVFTKEDKDNNVNKRNNEIYNEQETLETNEKNKRNKTRN